MQDRRNFLVQTTLAASAFTFLNPLKSFAGFQTKNISSVLNSTLTILHTSNIEGQIRPLGLSDKRAGLGGIDALSKAIGKIQKENGTTLLLDSKNLLNADVSSTYADKVKSLNYDATLSANVADLKDSLHTYKIRKGNLLIGIVTIANAYEKTIKNQKALYAMVDSKAEELKQHYRFDLVICLSQMDKSSDIEAAESSTCIDVIIGSSDCCSLHNTHIVRNQSGNEVIISNAGAKGTMLGRVDITFNTDRQKTNIASSPVFIGTDNKDFASIYKYSQYQA